MSTPANRRPRPAPEAPQQQGHFAPYFDRDALALSYLHSQGHLTRAEFRDNLRALGVRLGEDEEPRRLAVPQVVRIEPPARVAEVPFPAAAAPVHVPDEDDDEPWEPWDDDETEEG